MVLHNSSGKSCFYSAGPPNHDSLLRELPHRWVLSSVTDTLQFAELRSQFGT